MPTHNDCQPTTTSLKTLASCLHFHAAFALLVDKKKRETQYKRLRKHFCSNTDNCDLLVTNYVLGICSCLGLLQSFFSFCCIWK
jgi:hypothetical protein